MSLRYLRQLLCSNFAILLGLALLVSIVWVVVHERLALERRYTLEKIRTSNANIALGLDSYVRELIGRADAALIGTRHEYREHGQRFDMARLARDLRFPLETLRALDVWDENAIRVHGMGVADFSEGPPHLAELLARARTLDRDELLMGVPRRIPLTGEWVVDFARRIEKRDGSFGGVVLVVFDPTRFASFFGEASLRDKDYLMIVGTHGRTLLRMADGSVSIGDDMARSTLMKTVARHPQRGDYLTRGRREGVPRYTAYRKVQDLPLLVVVGVSQEEALQPLTQNARVYYSIAALSTLALLALTVLLMRALAQRQRDMRTLARNESRFRATFNQAFVGMAQSTPDGRLLQVNKTLCAILDRSEAQLLSRRLEDFLHEEDKGMLEAGPSEKRLVRADGEVAWVSMATTAVSDADGIGDCLVTVVQDITEFKRIDRMKSEFVSIVSHELRTPLTSIRGSLGLISGGVGGQLPQATRTLVDIAKNNCERLIRLINDILDTEKIESGKMRFDLKETDLGKLAQQALVANEALAREHFIRFELTAPVRPLRVKVDRDRLEQVLTNLLSNAAKFAPADSTVQVRLSRSGGRARLEVVDRGPGIPEEFRDRIFRKFSQADSSDSRQKGGTGLGLNISKAIVERLGGVMGFSTEVGLGTTFFFELPELEAAPAAPTRGPARPMVLICEDDIDTARVISLILANAGYDSDTAHTAAQARESLALRKYAAMTVDIELPDGDGIALMRELRQQEEGANLPFVVVSAFVEEGRLRINGDAHTASDWIAKPIDESRLVQALGRAIAGRPRILQVEPDGDLQCVTAAIAQDFAAFEFAGSVAEARTLLRRKRYDLVILELELPDGRGSDLLDELGPRNGSPAVMIYSMRHPTAEESRRASATIVKGKVTTNEQIRGTMQNVLQQRHQQRPALA